MASMKTASTNIYIVDDSTAIRSRLHEMLGRLDGVRVVGEAGAASQAVTEILSLRPHSVLLDLNLEGSSGMQPRSGSVPPGRRGGSTTSSTTGGWRRRTPR